MFTQTPPPRRRFQRRYVVGLGVFAIIGGCVAWTFRPLNSTERRLAGILFSPGGKQGGFCLRSNRRCMYLHPGQSGPPYEFVACGTWTATETQLLIDDKSMSISVTNWREFREQFRIWLNSTRTYSLEFASGHRILLNGEEFHRVPTP
jgi:hypothetical protein